MIWIERMVPCTSLYLLKGFYHSLVDVDSPQQMIVVKVNATYYSNIL